MVFRQQSAVRAAACDAFGMDLYGGAAMKRRAFTLIELLVVISIIALLIALLLPALARAKDEANSIGCAAKLRSLGQITIEYTNTYDGYIPPADFSRQHEPGIWINLLFSYYEGGQVVPDNVAYPRGYVTTHYSNSKLTTDLRNAYNGLFIDPGSPLQYPAHLTTSYWDTSYAANESVFITNLHNRGWDTPVAPLQCMKTSNIPHPGQIIALADVNLAMAMTSSEYDFGYADFSDYRTQSEVMADVALTGKQYAPNAPMAPQGVTGFDNSDDTTDKWLPSVGMRFRHMQYSATTGDANAVFCDGHVATIGYGDLHPDNLLLDPSVDVGGTVPYPYIP